MRNGQGRVFVFGFGDVNKVDEKRIKVFTISGIYDDDYGYEERLVNAPKMTIVYLKDENGNEKEVRVAEEFLVENGVVEGAEWKWG